MAEHGEVRLVDETETDRGWCYTVLLDWPGGERTEHELTLSWPDHESIGGGRSRPSEIAEGASLALLKSDLNPGEIPRRVDVSTLRRMIPGFDEAVREHLGGAGR